ncbi:YhcH/YjgK/YiaL family protein, partial [Streptococcus pneumoniae]
CHEHYPLLLGYHNFAIFFPGEPHQPTGYAGMEEKVRKYLFKILID